MHPFCFALLWIVAVAKVAVGAQGELLKIYRCIKMPKHSKSVREVDTDTSLHALHLPIDIHNPSPKPFTNGRKPRPLSCISLQCVLENLMPFRRIYLRFSERPNVGINRRTLWTLGVLNVHLVQTSLVEGVLAHKVHGREIETATAGGAAAGLENGGFGGQAVNFLPLGVGFGTVGVDQAAVLNVSC